MIRILLVEDDPVIRDTTSYFLKCQQNFEVVCADTGGEALSHAREKFDVILMDIKMPVMDGYEATSAIRKLSPDIPIVAVTAFAYPEDMRRILSSGFDGCLPKPVSADGLKKKIAELYPVWCRRSCH